MPTPLPLGHIERRSHRYVVNQEGVDRTYWELATYFALADKLAAGDIWVPTSRLYRSLDALITAPAPALPARVAVAPIPSADDWLATASAKLDAGLLDLARGLSRKRGASCSPATSCASPRKRARSTMIAPSSSRFAPMASC